MPTGLITMVGAVTRHNIQLIPMLRRRLVPWVYVIDAGEDMSVSINTVTKLDGRVAEVVVTHVIRQNSAPNGRYLVETPISQVETKILPAHSRGTNVGGLL